MQAFNVHILNAKSQQFITGTRPERAPMDAARYAKLELPFYKDLGTTISADTGNSGVNSKLLSISELEARAEPHYQNKVVELDDCTQGQALCTFKELLAAAEEAREATVNTQIFPARNSLEDITTSHTEPKRGWVVRLHSHNAKCAVM